MSKIDYTKPRNRTDYTRPVHTKLSPTEQEVIRHAMHGWTNKEIGERMGVTEGTVKAHLMNAMRKTQTKNRAHLCVTQMCIEMGKADGVD